MRPPDDTELLTAYATRHSEEAFTELVGRHVALVYSAALRQVREPQLAEDVTQAVFIILARKARAVSRHTALSGWLCRVAHFVSRDALRAERRRQHREQIVARMESSADTDWMQIAPLLDEVVAQLSEKDRSAIVLRFYEQKSFGEVGSVLGVDADAAQKRVSRALEKLRIIFAKRGVNSTTAIIAGAISANSVQAAPVALAKSVTAIAVAKGATAGGSTLTLIKGASKIMAWTKAKTAIVGGVVVLLASGTTTITVKVIQEHRTYSWQNPPACGNELDEVPPQVRIVPSKYSAFGECSRNGKILGLGTRVADILAAAYGVAPAHVFFSTGAPPGEFDFIANLANDNEQALQKEVKSKFGLVGRTEVRGTDVLLLKVKDAAKLQSHIFKDRNLISSKTDMILRFSAGSNMEMPHFRPSWRELNYYLRSRWWMRPAGREIIIFNFWPASFLATR
jgi:RNA polymerase sigma factor (sigma-70 family)